MGTLEEPGKPGHELIVLRGKRVQFVGNGTSREKMKFLETH